MSISVILLLILIGLLSGFLSGLVGVGGGIIMVPLLIMVVGLTQFQAQGTAIFTMLPPIGILAAINYYKAGHVNWEYAILIAVTFVVGGYLGSNLSLSLSPSLVRRVFGIVMLITALKLLFTK
tara:strand:+ start:11290 stop:11658 length:369 start_codon:yes stop_codon:yes gene_type:complete